MRRNQTFIGAAGLLELAQARHSCPSADVEPAAKRQRVVMPGDERRSEDRSIGGSQGKENQVGTTVGAESEASLLTLPATLRSISTHYGHMVLPASLLSMTALPLKAHRVVTASPTRPPIVMSPGCTPAVKNADTPGETGNTHPRWRDQLHEVTGNDDGLTRAIWSPALNAESNNTMRHLAQLAPRLLDGLKPDAAHDRVHQLLRVSRSQFMRSLQSRMPEAARAEVILAAARTLDSRPLRAGTSELRPVCGESGPVRAV